MVIYATHYNNLYSERVSSVATALVYTKRSDEGRADSARPGFLFLVGRAAVIYG